MCSPVYLFLLYLPPPLPLATTIVTDERSAQKDSTIYTWVNRISISYSPSSSSASPISFARSFAHFHLGMQRKLITEYNPQWLWGRPHQGMWPHTHKNMHRYKCVCSYYPRQVTSHLEQWSGESEEAISVCAKLISFAYLRRLPSILIACSRPEKTHSPKLLNRKNEKSLESCQFSVKSTG